MKNKVKQILSVVMSVSMLSTMIPLTTYGAEFDSEESAVTVEDETPVSEDVNVSGDESTDSSATSTEDAFQSGDAEDPFSADDEDAFSAGDEQDTDVFADTPEAEDFDYVTSNASVPLTDTNMRIFHLDAGRKYFSVKQIENLIDTLNENGYNYMELAVGNDALRFLLDDMSVVVGETTYTSVDVTNGIKAGNTTYCNQKNADASTLSENEMNSIIAYAESKNVSIIPLLNSPGHMDSILTCMENLKIANVRYNSSATTMDVTNSDAVNFTTALIKKYAEYFAGKGCKIFNMGVDEYNGATGFGQLQNRYNYKYGYFVNYVNSIASTVKTAGMVPMAFNDGIYYNYDESNRFDTDIAIAYWTSGYPEYFPASASFLASKGHKIINTNDAWYYVLGRKKGDTSGYTSATALDGVKGTKYADVPGDNDPSVSGAMVCLWCDNPSASYSDNSDNDEKKSEVDKVAEILKTFATNNSDVFQTKEPDKKPDNGAVEENKRTINLVVGGTATDTIKGYNYKDQTVETEDTSIATVEVTDGKSVGDTQESYKESSNVTYKALIKSDSNNWEKTNYYYSPDGINYYPLWAKRTSQRGNRRTYYNYYWGYGESKNNITSAGSDNWIYSGDSSRSGPEIKVYSKTTTTVAEASTELKFTGVAIGTTVATIGNVVYTITVSEKAPDGAMTNTSIDLEYWITNYEVYESSDETGHTESITTSTDKATTDEGIAITDIAPNHAYSFFDGTKDVYYWQAMRLDSKHQQTNVSGDDETANGTTLTHVRYHSGAWQYKTIDGTWHYFVSTDQLVAYYLQKTDVTREIVTYAKDWGYGTNDTTSNTSSGKGQVALTVAVVYPDGTVSPVEGDMYANSTTIFNYWDGRDIGIVAPQNNSDYNISKITVTDGTRDKNTSDIVWYTSDSITWNYKTLASGDKWYDETTVWEKSSGTTPMVNGKNRNITWSAKNTAKLVLIYLEPIAKATNLNVRYVDDSENEAAIAEYQIAMSFKQGDPEPTFKDKLIQTSDVTTGKFTLDDDAYVTNSSNVNQHISKKLATVANTQGITDVKYLNGSYEYERAEISEDGKTLTLHYNYNKENIKQKFIVDFGERVDVKISDFDNEGIVQSIESVSSNAEKNDNGSELTYIPKKVLTGMDVVSLTVKYKSGSTGPMLLGFVPATTVYYEETFVDGGDGATNLATQQPAKPGDTQKTEKAASNYGYDSTYAKGGAMISSESTIDIKGIRREFTFTGTGVDIYANTKTDTGTMMIYVKKDNNVINMVAVDTKMKNGSTNVTGGQEVKGTNVPVATLNMGTYATYTVVIQGVKTGKEGLKPVYFDGFRVYNTLNDDSSNAIYAQDKEANPSYCELRDQVLNAINVDSVIDNGNGKSQYAKQVAGNVLSQVYASNGVDSGITAVVLSKKDANGDNSNVDADDAQDLLDNGPKNELYLRNGQIVTFNLNKAAQIGLKGVNGDATFTINGTQKSVSTTDMFYPVSSGTITIENTSNNLLSITKIKAFIGSNNVPEKTVASALFAPLSEDDLVPAMIALGYEADPAKPSETPAPTKTPEKPVKLSAPKLGKVVSVNYNSVKVTWGKVKNADGYRVYMKENGKWKTLAKVDSTSYVCKGLKTGKKYTFTVTAYKKTSNGVVLSAYDKKGISGTPKLGTPVLKSVKRSGSGVIFTWNKTAGANGYVVYRKVNNGEWRAVAKVTKGTTYKDTTAKKGAKYTYTVRALRKSGTTNVYSDYNAKGISVK